MPEKQCISPWRCHHLDAPWFWWTVNKTQESSFPWWRSARGDRSWWGWGWGSNPNMLASVSQPWQPHWRQTWELCLFTSSKINPTNIAEISLNTCFHFVRSNLSLAGGAGQGLTQQCGGPPGAQALVTDRLPRPCHRLTGEVRGGSGQPLLVTVTPLAATKSHLPERT